MNEQEVLKWIKILHKIPIKTIEESAKMYTDTEKCYLSGLAKYRGKQNTVSLNLIHVQLAFFQITLCSIHIYRKLLAKDHVRILLAIILYLF